MHEVSADRMSPDNTKVPLTSVDYVLIESAQAGPSSLLLGCLRLLIRVVSGLYCQSEQKACCKDEQLVAFDDLAWCVVMKSK